ncbi:hypothetical protein GDO78_017677 [Eleutherodactylus coqui]|uniref:Uncharacterized protein n=1 Tax=Eleutherodactylus coqui TaxID=57060 RepID=A0A8J6BQR2_ELECQ|nr:hypothetical protein GDO78_017677 [Eleutherodactylus coqui]
MNCPSPGHSDQTVRGVLDQWMRESTQGDRAQDAPDRPPQRPSRACQSGGDRRATCNIHLVCAVISPQQWSCLGRMQWQKVY